MRVNFWILRFENGFIEIPNIPILENTMEIDRQFLNLVAFEQCYPHCRKYVTSYAIFMNCFINSDKDVKILCRKGIIMDGPVNKELVPYLIDNMAKGVMMKYEDFYLSDVCMKINEYSKRTTPKLRASFNSYLRAWLLQKPVGNHIFFCCRSPAAAYCDTNLLYCISQVCIWKLDFHTFYMVLYCIV